jgi:hypothetical protein
MAVDFSLLKTPQDYMKGNRMYDYIQQGQQTGLNAQQSRLNDLNIQKTQNDLAVQPQLNQQAIATNQASLDKMNFEQKKREVDLIANAAGSLVNLPDDAAVNDAYQKNILPALKNVIPNMPATMTKGQAQAYYTSAITAQNQINAAINQQNLAYKQSLPLSEAGKAQYDVNRNLISPDQQQQFYQNKRPQININNNPELKGSQAFEEQYNKQLAKQYDEIQTVGNAAQDNLQRLQTAKQLAAQTKTGALEPTKVWAAAIAESLGVDPKTLNLNSATNAQALTGVVKDLVLEKQKEQKGVQVESDAKRIEDSLPSLIKTGKANEFLSNANINFTQRKIDKAQFYNDYLEKGLPPKGANKAWLEYANSTPVVGNKLDAQGMPIMLYDFIDAFMKRNPDATKEDALNYWRTNYTDTPQKKTLKSAREVILQ